MRRNSDSRRMASSCIRSAADNTGSKASGVGTMMTPAERESRSVKALDEPAIHHQLLRNGRTSEFTSTHARTTTPAAPQKNQIHRSTMRLSATDGLVVVGRSLSSVSSPSISMYDRGGRAVKSQPHRGQWPPFADAS